jgi:hypothetical protein
LLKVLFVKAEPDCPLTVRVADTGAVKTALDVIIERIEALLYSRLKAI